MSERRGACPLPLPPPPPRAVQASAHFECLERLQLRQRRYIGGENSAAPAVELAKQRQLQRRKMDLPCK